MNGCATAIMRMWPSAVMNRLPYLAALVGAVEHRRSALPSGAARLRPSSCRTRSRWQPGSRLFVKPSALSRLNLWIVQLRVGEAQRRLAEVLAQRPFVERELNLEAPTAAPLRSFAMTSSVKPFACRRGRVDVRAAFQRADADGILDDVFDLRLGVAELAQRRRHATG